MSDERQSEAVWVFPEKKRNKVRIWLIIGLSTLALVIVSVVLFFILPRNGAPELSPSPSSASATPSPTPTSSPLPTPTPEPIQTQPPLPNPDVDTFVGQVQPLLDDAVRGLQLVKENMDLGAQIVDSLQKDAEVLSDTPTPSSISEDWSDAVVQYAAKLRDLRAAYESGSATPESLDASNEALQNVRSVVGL